MWNEAPDNWTKTKIQATFVVSDNQAWPNVADNADCVQSLLFPTYYLGSAVIASISLAVAVVLF